MLTCAIPERFREQYRTHYKVLYIQTCCLLRGSVVDEMLTIDVRMLMTNEDLEVQNIGLQLHHDPSTDAKKRSPCCN